LDVMVAACRKTLPDIAFKVEPSRRDGLPSTDRDGLLDSLRQGFLLIGSNLRVRRFNDAFVQLHSFPPALVRRGVALRTIIAASVESGHYPGLTIEEAYQLWLHRLEERKLGQHFASTIEGSTFSIHYAPVGNGSWAITYEDVSALVKAESALAEQNDRFDAAFKNIPHGVCMFDDKGQLVLCNEAYARLYSLPPALAVRGASLQNILEYRNGLGVGPAEMNTYFDVIEDAAWAGKASSRRIPLADGRIIRITHNPILSGGYVAMHEDMTQAASAEERIRFLATHDVLTGLPNRRELRERAAAALGRLGAGETLCVYYIDLDDFKSVNDSHGSDIGDLLLMAIAGRLQPHLESDDLLFRIGGDEFAVLQGPGADLSSYEAVAQQLVFALSQPFHLAGGSFHLSAVLGAAVAPAHGTEVGDLLRNADTALYAAKADGRGILRFFEPRLDELRQAKRALESDLRRALGNDEFELHYQPQVDATSARLMGYEALIRWRHPRRGMVSPAEFIPFAEELGLIAPIGAWVLRQACMDAALWPSHLRVAVNLSSHQFHGGCLVETVRDALAHASIDPSRLELEITESVLLADNAEILEALKALKNLGAHIALDDFGTAYSSLSYLRSFPVDKIKIDRSFIKDIGAKKDCLAIVRALAALAAALDMTTTAEGVETAEELHWVRECGCSQVQGYYFGRPRPAGQLFPSPHRLTGDSASWT
jgi:diguanylate cyclase (GGDEF)-like protein